VTSPQQVCVVDSATKTTDLFPGSFEESNECDTLSLLVCLEEIYDKSTSSCNAISNRHDKYDKRTSGGMLRALSLSSRSSV